LRINFFTELTKINHQCQEFIEKTSDKYRLILIVSGRLGRQIFPKIHHLRRMTSIYIYCMDKKVNEKSKQMVKLYRAEIISKDELENLKNSVNQFISINSFFSTTSNYQKALSFFKGSKTTATTEKILYEIKANPNVGKTKPFANISQQSQYQKEEEVLFMIGSIFQLTNISFDETNQCSIIKMTLRSDEEKQIFEF